ncbi:hypothetical protein [Micavibrio aeruginosavorus]|uniref:hypothetical protein n=1 Tax=Micavibrio aeruginosavorus TaxID=349221 RepID=UPI003F4ACA42
MNKKLRTFAIPFLCSVFMGAAHADDIQYSPEISFADIPTHGDARAKATIEAMRKTPDGEALYQNAARTGAKFRWITEGGDGKSGLYDDGILSVKSAQKNSAVLLVTVHELVHHFQETQLQLDKRVLSPIYRYNALHLSEVDACAKTAIFNASYTDLTGQNLIEKQESYVGYGDKTAYEYAATPLHQRNVFKQAYEGCFAEIPARYSDYFKRNANIAGIYLRPSLVATKEVLTGKADPVKVYKQYFATMPVPQRHALFQQFFTTDIQSGKVHPSIAKMDAASFDNWIMKRTEARTNKDVQSYEQIFRKYQDIAKEYLPAKSPKPGA